MVVFSCSATTLTGTVARVIDGDTAVIQPSTNFAPFATFCKHSGVRIRLADIDAPELRQPHGRESKRVLESLVLKKSVVIRWTKRDRYRRLIGTLQINGTNVNHLLVRRGHAWHYRRYSRSEQLAELQAKAKADRVGVWRDRQIIPPWQWRRKRRTCMRALHSVKRKVRMPKRAVTKRY